MASVVALRMFLPTPLKESKSTHKAPAGAFCFSACFSSIFLHLTDVLPTGEGFTALGQ